MRYNPNGSLDTSFDGDGKLTTAIGSSNAVGFGVALQADGKIVVSGAATIGGGNDVAVVRYNPNGTLDTSFDGDGMATTAIGAGADNGIGVAIQADGKIVVSASSHNGSDNDLAVVRYDPNGSLDTSFDGDGRAVTAIGTGNDGGAGVAIQANGKIVVGGFACFAQCNGVVVRYATNGSLDPTFNGGGVAVVAIQAGNPSQFGGVALQADGKIVAGGFTNNGSNNDFGVARLLGDPVCGDTVVGPGEQCDDGNTLNGDCCSSTCQYEANSVVCRASAGACDLAEQCTGASGTCPPDIKSTAACRGSAGVCDIVESCDGVSDDCPPDSLEPATTVCRAASAGEVCDVVETCTGAGPNCPGDAVEPNSTVCRASSVGEVCDIPENCDGTNKTCPVDAVQPGGSSCRASAGVCDVGETCDGSSKFCPSDAKSTASCRASAGACDVAESCDGVGNDCPTDGFATDGSSCDDALFCNGVQTCSSGACGGSSSPCAMGQSCDEASDQCFVGYCPTSPAMCRTAAKNKLLIKNNTSDDDRDKLVWKWTRGAATTQAEFADPTVTTSYALCFYAGSTPTLLQGFGVPPAGGNWSAIGTKGYKYTDPTGANDGITKIIVKGGAGGKSKVLVKGKGGDLPDFDTDLPIATGDLPLIVQLRNSTNGLCWQGSFATPKKNLLTQFNAKGP